MVPPTCMYGPPCVKCLHVLYDSYGPPNTLYGIGIVWSPHMYYMTLMVPHTLYGIGILWFPLTLYGTGIVWCPQHVRYDFSGQLWKRSTACPNNSACTYMHKMHAGIWCISVHIVHNKQVMGVKPTIRVISCKANNSTRTIWTLLEKKLPCHPFSPFLETDLSGANKTEILSLFSFLSELISMTRRVLNNNYASVSSIHG